MKNTIKFIKELYKRPKGKAILFFGGYLLFFIVLMIVVRVVSPNTTKSEDYEKGNVYDYSISNLVNGNYKYTYTITCDNKKSEYVGKSDGKDEMFIYDKVDYYRNSEGFYNNKSGTFIKSDNPFKYYYFLQLDNINDIYGSAYYVSKTEFDDARQSYNYLISTNTLVKLQDKKNIDISDNANEISLSTDSDGYVNKLDLTLDSYAAYKKECNGKLRIILEYSDYGDIETIKNPLNK